MGKRFISNVDELRDGARDRFLDVLSHLNIHERKGLCLCPNPEHNDRNPSCQVNTRGRFAGQVHCYACGYSADSYKLVNDLEFNGLGHMVEIWEYLSPIIGVSVEYSDGTNNNIIPKKKLTEKEKLEAFYKIEEDLTEYKWDDYTSFYKEANKALHNNPIALQYLFNRGFTRETIDRFCLGFYLGKYSAPRVIVPITRGYFLGRDIRPNLTKSQERYSKLKTPHAYPQIFNVRALYQDESPVFVVEGEFDAIALMQCGVEAVAIGGTGGYHRLIRSIMRSPKRPKLFLALDADEAGRKAACMIKKELEILELYKFGENAFFFNCDTEYFKDALYFGCKDANEALIQNKDELQKRLNMAIESLASQSA